MAFRGISILILEKANGYEHRGLKLRHVAPLLETGNKLSTSLLRAPTFRQEKFCEAKLFGFVSDVAYDKT